jgi:hypothetical protein
MRSWFYTSGAFRGWLGRPFDFGVPRSAEDAKRMGFDAILLDDGRQSIDVEGSAAAARARVQALGAPA